MFRNLSIKAKVVTVIMMTTLIVLLLTVVAFTIYDLVSFENTLALDVKTTGLIITEESTAALTFGDEENAARMLAALRADRHIVAGALYTKEGKLLAHYPPARQLSEFPAQPGALGSFFRGNDLIVWLPAMERGERLGTLYLKGDLSALQSRLRTYLGIAFAVMAGSLLIAFGVSNALQTRITSPILALAGWARTVSDRADYSLRVRKTSEDELGALTDAFNLMLERIQQQTIALRESEEKRRLALEAARIGTWDWNFATQRVAWDNYLHALYGLKPGDFDGTYDSFLELVHPDDRQALADAMQQSIASKQELQAEYRIVWPDQTVHVLVSRGKAFYDDVGKPLRFTGITLDVTERRQAEEVRSFLASIVNSSDDSIVGKDLQGRIVSWNAGAEQMFGYTAADMLGQPIDKLTAPDRPNEENELLQEVCRGDTRHFETIRMRKDGTPIEVSMTVSPIRNPRGEIIGVSSISRDITEAKRIQQALEQQVTERKRAEDEVRNLNAQLEQRVQQRTIELTNANQEMEAFTYSVAHDLRAPLRHIDAFTRILYEDHAASLPAEARRYLDNIRNGSRNMSRLVDDLLNLARIGRQELRRQPTPLSPLISEVITELHDEMQDRKIDWQIHPLPTLPCDAGLMKQVFINLLSNAIKYTRPRDIAVIEIGAKQDNGSTQVFVRDNGVGFSMKYADKLFGVFQRLHRAEEFEGTGVGLATVDRIIRKHGGRVWAEAAQDKGATFYFTVGKS